MLAVGVGLGVATGAGAGGATVGAELVDPAPVAACPPDAPPLAAAGATDPAWAAEPFATGPAFTPPAGARIAGTWTRRTNTRSSSCSAPDAGCWGSAAGAAPKATGAAVAAEAVKNQARPSAVAPAPTVRRRTTLLSCAFLPW